jgi:5'-nucleotidase
MGKRNPDFAVINSGSIRAGIASGPITLANIYNTLPFQNNVSTFKLKGSIVKEMLEHAASKAENSTNEGTGRFLQVSGLRVTGDLDAPLGKRIKKIVITSKGREEEINMTTYYTVVAPDFIRKGGDGFHMLSVNATDVEDNGPLLTDALISYLTKTKIITPYRMPRLLGK